MTRPEHPLLSCDRARAPAIQGPLPAAEGLVPPLERRAREPATPPPRAQGFRSHSPPLMASPQNPVGNACGAKAGLGLPKGNACGAKAGLGLPKGNAQPSRLSTPTRYSCHRGLQVLTGSPQKGGHCGLCPLSRGGN